MELYQHCYFGLQGTDRIKWRKYVGLLRFYRKDNRTILFWACVILQEKKRMTLNLTQKSVALPFPTWVKGQPQGEQGCLFLHCRGKNFLLIFNSPGWYSLCSQGQRWHRKPWKWGHDPRSTSVELSPVAEVAMLMPKVVGARPPPKAEGAMVSIN